MERKSDLKPAEKEIIQLLNQGKTSLDSSKIIHRDHRTVKSYVANSNKVRQRSDKRTFRKISCWVISSIKRAVAKKPTQQASRYLMKLEFLQDQEQDGVGF